jgi:hypothetical protein
MGESMVLEGVGGEGGGVLPPARPAELEAEPPTGRELEPVREGEERTGARRPGDWALAAAERLEEGVTRRLELPLATGCVLAGVVLELAGLAWAWAGAVASASGATGVAWGSGGTASGFRLASLVSGSAVSGGGAGVSAPGAAVSGIGGTGLLAASVSGAIGTSWLVTVIVVAPAGWDLAEARVRERRGAGAMESGGSRTGEAGETANLSRRGTSDR